MAKIALVIFRRDDSNLRVPRGEETNRPVNPPVLGQHRPGPAGLSADSWFNNAGPSGARFPGETWISIGKVAHNQLKRLLLGLNLRCAERDVRFTAGRPDRIKVMDLERKEQRPSPQQNDRQAGLSQNTGPVAVRVWKKARDQTRDGQDRGYDEIEAVPFTMRPENLRPDGKIERHPAQNKADDQGDSIPLSP